MFKVTFKFRIDERGPELYFWGEGTSNGLDPEALLKLMTLSLLFLNMIWRLSSLDNRAACLIVSIGYRTEARALMLACRAI